METSAVTGSLRRPPLQRASSLYLVWRLIVGRWIRKRGDTSSITSPCLHRILPVTEVSVESSRNLTSITISTQLYPGLAFSTTVKDSSCFRDVLDQCWRAHSSAEKELRSILTSQTSATLRRSLGVSYESSEQTTTT